MAYVRKSGGGEDREVYVIYSDVVFTPASATFNAIGSTWMIEKGKYKKVRFHGWQGGNNTNDAVTIYLRERTLSLVAHANDATYKETVDGGDGQDPTWSVLGSLLMKDKNEYVGSPWFSLDPDTNYLGLYTKGNGSAQFQPQEWSIEVTTEENPPAWS